MEWLIFSLTACLLAYLGNRGKKIDIVFRVLLIVCLSYVTGFGGIANTDHAAYEDLFLNIRTYKLSDFAFTLSVKNNAYEFGYALLNYVASYVGLGVAGFFFFIAFITNALLVSVFYRYSKHIVFTILLFITSIFFIQEPNLIRQTLAASIVLYGIRYIEDDKPWLYVLTVVIATLLHTASLLFLLIFLFKYIDTKKSKRTLLVIISSLWLISLLFLYEILHSNFLGLLQGFTYYSGYLTPGNLQDITHTVQHDIFNLGFIAVIVYYLFVNSEKKVDLYIIMFFLGPIFYNLGPSSYMFFRFSYFFLAAVVIALPNILYEYGECLKSKFHVFYHIYYIYSIYVLIAAYILKETPVFFEEMYKLSDFFA